MSRENGEVLRQSLDAFNRRDKAPWVALCDPGVEWLPPARWPETATIRGPQAAWEFMLALNEPWEEGSYELMELIDGSADISAARVRRHVRGRSSGISAEFDYWAAVRFSDGKVHRMVRGPRRGPQSRRPAGVNDVARQQTGVLCPARDRNPRARRKKVTAVEPSWSADRMTTFVAPAAPGTPSWFQASGFSFLVHFAPAFSVDHAQLARLQRVAAANRPV